MKSPLNPLPFELKQDEHLLWSYTAENKPAPASKRRSLWPLAILLLVLALAGRAVEWLNISDEFSFLARTCMYLAVIVALVAKTERNTGRYEVYALSNKRAYIIELSTSKKHVPVVLSFAVQPQMVYRILHRSNGHMDYYLGSEQIGKEPMPRGFINLPPEYDPASIFGQLGIVLPAENETLKPRLIRRPKIKYTISWKKILISCLLALGLWLHSGYIYMYFAGQETTATVVDYEKEDDEDPEYTMFFPVAIFTTVSGDVCKSTCIQGTSGAPEYEIGAQIPLIYDPANPEYAMINEDSLIATPAIIALVLICLLLSLRKEVSERRKLLKSPYILVETN